MAIYAVTVKLHLHVAVTFIFLGEYKCLEYRSRQHFFLTNFVRFLFFCPHFFIV